MKTHSHIIVGLGYGDEGKGTMVDYLCRLHGATLVVRYNGGSQAAHNVVTDDGRHHTFAQFGSGTFVPGVKTLLSRYMLWDPISLAHEAAELAPKIGENALSRHFIDSRAPVITPFHAATNRLKEWARGNGRHGSCGKGVGELAYDLVYHSNDVLMAGHILNSGVSEKFLRRIQVRKLKELKEAGADLALVPDTLVAMRELLINTEEPKKIAEAYKAMTASFNIIPPVEVDEMIRENVNVFEGAQGVLLDEWHGFHPYTTWSTITPKNAIEILREANAATDYEIVGVVRAYGTRHGAGPFITERKVMRHISPNENNGVNAWQGEFRCGAFDGVQFRYALECLKRHGGIHCLAVTHLDVFDREEIVPLCGRYIYPGKAPLGLVGHGGYDEALDKTVVRNLVPNFGEDLVHQEALTNFLLKAEADDTESFKTPDEVIHHVELDANVKVKYLSFGPQPAHKRVVL